MKRYMNWKALPWVAVAVMVVAVLAVVMIPKGQAGTGPGPPTLVGDVLIPKQAPDFRLTDQFGQAVTLQQLRGNPAIITFMEAHCREQCPLVAEKIRQSVVQLGAVGKRIKIVAISADPEGDTRQAVLAFSRQHGLLHRWLYLNGPRSRLQPIWQAYGIYAAPANAPAAIRDSHTTATYLLDRQGRERVLVVGNQETSVASLKQDLSILSGVTTTIAAGQGAPAPQIGHPAPDFALQTTSGKTLRLSDFRGKTILVNFWATWCIPCRSEAPRLSQWYQRYRMEGLVVLGVDQQEGASDVNSFVRDHHLNYPIVLDSNATTDGRYDIGVLPVSYLVNARGAIVAIHYGEVDNSFLSDHVLPLVRSSAA